MKIKNDTIVCLGEHLLLCGDATKPEPISRLLSGKKVNLILTDPPYGVAYVESKKDFHQEIAKPKKIIGDHLQSELEYTKFTRQWLELAKPYLKRKNALYIFNSDKMLFALREGLIQAGFKFAQLLVWAKTHAVVGRMDYLPQHELIAYGWYGVHKFHKSKDKTVLIYPKPNKSKSHPTMKPIGLLRRIILNSSKANDTIYDPFGGSGSTLLACEQTKRKCLMVEEDLEYCKTIIESWEKLTKQKAELYEQE